MATSKGFSMPVWTQYVEARYQEALRADWKANAKKMNYPSKEEIANGIVDQFDLTAQNTLAAIPEAISGFMKDEGRQFDLPAPDKKTAPASLKTVAVGQKTKTGTKQFGPHKGESYKTVTKAHEEVKVKNRTKDFKESK